MTLPLLRAEKLTRHYEVQAGGRVFGRRQPLKAVEDVSFTLRPGQTLGLVGESGCGKTTTAKLALGLIQPTAGRLLFEEEPVPASNTQAWRRLRRRMQLVYQDPLGALDRLQPAGKQVMEPLEIHGMGTRVERREQALELFASVGLKSHHFDSYPHELSGGQRQRVVLARALIMRPSLLVCDEPISALDVSIQAQVINLLLDLQQRLGIGYLFISHDLRVVRQVSDEVAVMYLGSIVEQGPPDHLLKSPLHPYTRALVSAIPTVRGRRGPERIVLQGDPPNPVERPSGCPFHTRCPVAQARCRVEKPALTSVGEGRLVSCHFPGSTVARPRLVN